MGKFITVFMYILWTMTIIGVLVITFNGFQYTDLNLIVAILFLFSLLNTFLAVKGQ